MMRIKRSAEIAYSPKQMFDLVNDIKAYPEFLTWCVATEVQSASSESVTASISVSAFGYRKTFTTNNRLESPHRIMIDLVDGPFNSLQGIWEFKAIDPDKSRVTFELEFEFIDKALSYVVYPILNKMASQLVSTFMNRAEMIYA